jgi:hypothetical protein
MTVICDTLLQTCFTLFQLCRPPIERLRGHWRVHLALRVRQRVLSGADLRVITQLAISHYRSRIYPEMMDGPNDESMQGLLISGSVAREALMED